ncbi:Peptidyl-tRNA hydrolase ArfB [Candidatus Terasakiella magnetica]|uniref:Peptidyl-tRNA hydrolase ArfB n=1 Tax=Candidatus Terasakiella magnetica TaxID=1867952 RepID=A0A1C3RKG6_9PROT|nr:alternative ribosome rescue aminoacyl-tRNA hydrolase ArfB [Candidatus Terasakiella magnetica]SCA57738.1 Peptidyl-tRNA hydrolase ArfB [Candidatus Terasakiella magnetica]
MIKITNTVFIDESEIEEKFIRSPGSGGQKVNKTESAVQLRFNARACRVLSYAVFMRLQKIAGSRMSKDGVIVLTAHTHRTQEMNRADGLARLVKMIAQACVSPKKRRATKPTKASKKRRLEGKKRTSDIKKSRSRVRTY